MVIVMEYVRGESLGELVRTRGPLDDVAAARVWSSIAGALDAAHGHGVLHRDVKPGNIVLDADGQAHLIDFGIARKTGDATLTATGFVLGTPDFLRARGRRGRAAPPAQSDSWQLAATVCYALCGQPPRGDHADAVSGLRAAGLGGAADAPAAPVGAPDAAARRLHDDPARRPPLRGPPGTGRLAAVGRSPPRRPGDGRSGRPVTAPREPVPPAPVAPRTCPRTSGHQTPHRRYVAASPIPVPQARGRHARATGSSSGPRQRLDGVDAARAVALVGMASVHILPVMTAAGTETLAGAVAAGRASALFAVLAGVGVALSTGGRTPPARGRPHAAAAPVAGARCAGGAGRVGARRARSAGGGDPRLLRAAVLSGDTPGAAARTHPGGAGGGVVRARAGGEPRAARGPGGLARRPAGVRGVRRARRVAARAHADRLLPRCCPG